ncbi:hypothetical protein [Bifidobacterium bombi]|nr:hypothetical protein [Bifidobacterium bombi]
MSRVDEATTSGFDKVLIAASMSQENAFGPTPYADDSNDEPGNRCR